MAKKSKSSSVYKRTLWVRVVAIVLAALMIGSVITALFFL